LASEGFLNNLKERENPPKEAHGTVGEYFTANSVYQI